MSKNIIICADGTGNRGGVGRGTNVWRLYNALDLQTRKFQQIAKYHDGVGTDTTLLIKILGAAFGWGLTENVRSLYRYIALNYQLGDQVFLFGFSRGAYTVRVLNNILYCMGVPKDARSLDPKALDESVRWVVDTYKDACKLAFKNKGDIQKSLAKEFKGLSTVTEESKDRQKIDSIVIGVWDTVNAVGAPANWIRRLLGAPWTYDGAIESLPGETTHARQALSLDDERSTFNPLFWLNDSSDSVNNHIIQVWFSGMHSNVGGGYPKDGLAYLSLRWMINEIDRISVNTGGNTLHFLPAALTEINCQANAHDKMYDSRSSMAVYYRYSPRKILTVVNRGNQDYLGWIDNTQTLGCDEIEYLNENSEIRLPLIHSSVINRLVAHTDSYLPIVIPNKFKVWTDSDLSNTKDQTKNKDDDFQISNSEPKISEVNLKLVSDGVDAGISLKECFTTIEQYKSRRGLIWAVFSILSTVLFLAPVIDPVRQYGCEFLHLFCGDNQIQETAENANSMPWIVPDITKPWVNWMLDHRVISILVLAVMAFLYTLNRRYKSIMKFAGHNYWKLLPEESLGGFSQSILDSPLMNLQPEIVNKKLKSEKPKRTGKLKNAASGIRKLSKFAKKINGNDY